MEEKRHCLRCFLEEIDPAAYERDIKRILDHMEPGERAKDRVRDARLSACRTCGYLNAGTCTACGCFVELRASMRTGHCPYHRWETKRQEEGTDRRGQGKSR